MIADRQVGSVLSVNVGLPQDLAWQGRTVRTAVWKRPVEGPASSTIQRRTPDGTAYRIVKVPHEPADLERRLRELGWDITVTPTAGPFFWGAGNRAEGLC